MNSEAGRVTHAHAFAKPGASRIDVDLAQALHALANAPHAESECIDSIRIQALETVAWIGSAALVWLIVAILL